MNKAINIKAKIKQNTKLKTIQETSIEVDYIILLYKRVISNRWETMNKWMIYKFITRINPYIPFI